MLDNSIYNLLIKELRQAIKDGDIEKVKTKALRAHELVHDKQLTHNSIDTFQNEALAGLNEKSFRYTTSKKYQGYRTIAFFIFHMTRIEDICANTLIANDTQVIFQDNWIEKMNVNRVDTGNSMSQTEMVEFSSSINQKTLFDYRLAVAKKTRNIIQKLTSSDLKVKPTQDQLDFILTSKSVLNHEDSIWLIDFWGKKNVGGLLLMPITRHQKVHLNDCYSIIKSTK
ncbi:MULTISPECIES: hypothetical protein [unclassified Breznakia]|uniref:hypothetical protein n=1 Tax=unclassified Breznakia TaxID=2623764 RepID=UPI002475A1FC|nr:MULTISPECIES: hypothetical protein [unclassified Breznakia]MDH6366416.1 hypothetical protein [Breznakia sp. PH1-1]MDH6403509.1 hypothetical protein [Breznakia sp. PF1-11]MDH6411218.1 hypothetical protein [Breznakia sp. PFB1-11]MDH6413519.1 hypothetical protein [Breznakia sp. PFB1-14]MDH6415763.1 hypothetical protein [Breznakia sp. PFB1-4]